jgi:hypothetical protein
MGEASSGMKEFFEFHQWVPEKTLALQAHHRTLVMPMS